MGEYWIPRLPFLGTAAARGGAMVGTPDNCRHMLENEECVMVFPEGVRGISKPWRERYRLRRFGLGFMRLALEARAPIVPVGIVGSEEQQPGLANLPRLARLLGMPAFPITPTFPWLGPLEPPPAGYRRPRPRLAPHACRRPDHDPGRGGVYRGLPRHGR